MADLRCRFALACAICGDDPIILNRIISNYDLTHADADSHLGADVILQRGVDLRIVGLKRDPSTDRIRRAIKLCYQRVPP